MRIFVDMDDVLCAWSAARDVRRLRSPEVPYPQSLPGFYRTLEPLPGAIAGFSELRERFDVWILTAPSVLNPLCYTEKRLWVEDHFGLKIVERLIISPDKSLLRGNYLVDDNAFGRGQDAFSGTLIHFGSPEFPGWPAVTAFFQSL